MQSVLLHLSKDKILQEILPENDISPFEGNRNLYDDLLRSIVGQQLSVKAASTIYGRFVDLFGHKPNPDELLELELETLRSVGLSKQKATYVQNVASYFKENELQNTDWADKSNEEIINQLSTIKGVGKWTVQMILMFSLHRPDVFPVDDLGIRNAMIRLYKIEETGRALKTKMETIAEAWSPYRTYACYYLWNWKDNTPA